MPLQTIRNDITKMETDAIVLPANKWLEQGSGTSRAIYQAAGEQKLVGELRMSYPDGCPLGEAVITFAYNLPAKKIIHAVCPKWYGGNRNEKELLYSAYWNSLQLAKDDGLKSISFPLLSAGNYGYPKEEAIAVANRAITDFLLQNQMDVYLVLYTDDAVDVGARLYNDIKQYIDAHYVASKDESYESGRGRRERIRSSILRPPAQERRFDTMQMDSLPVSENMAVGDSLEEVLEKKAETFHEMLMRLIDDSGMSSPEIYDRAFMSRQQFSKIKNDPDRQLKKKTILSLAIAMKLGLSTTNELLKKAGYALSDSSKWDLIVSYYLLNEEYDIDAINIGLEKMGEKDFFGYN